MADQVCARAKISRRSQIKRCRPARRPNNALAARAYVWGEVRDDNGRVVTGRITTPDGYTLTVLTALAIVEQALGGRHPIGFQTPAKAYGSDLIFTLPGVARLP